MEAVRIDHTRHSGIYDASHLSATIIGAGGIGAITAYTLAKMGVSSINVMDHDLVGPENISTQWHRLSDIGKNKAVAVQEEIIELAGDKDVRVWPYRFEPGMTVQDHIIISAVDSIEARQNIYLGAKCNWFIDARMGAEEFQLFTVNMRDAEIWTKYEDQLFSISDESIPDLPCTSKATMYTANFGAGYIGLAIRAISSGMPFPFRIVHNLPNHFFWTQNG